MIGHGITGSVHKRKVLLLIAELFMNKTKYKLEFFIKFADMTYDLKKRASMVKNWNSSLVIFVISCEDIWDLEMIIELNKM